MTSKTEECIAVPIRYLSERLIMCCERGELKELSFLIKYIPEHLTKFTDNDFNALMTAVYSFQNHALFYLLSESLSSNFAAQPIADLSIIKNRYGSTLLHVAAYRCNVDAVDILLRHAMYFGKTQLQRILNSTDKWGKTPLHHAVYHECLFIVQRLLCFKEMDIDIQDTNGKTAMDYCLYNKPAVLEAFQSRHTGKTVWALPMQQCKPSCQTENLLDQRTSTTARTTTTTNISFGNP